MKVLDPEIGSWETMETRLPSPCSKMTALCLDMTTLLVFGGMGRGQLKRPICLDLDTPYNAGYPSSADGGWYIPVSSMLPQGQFYGAAAVLLLDEDQSLLLHRSNGTVPCSQSSKHGLHLHLDDAAAVEVLDGQEGDDFDWFYSLAGESASRIDL